MNKNNTLASVSMFIAMMLVLICCSDDKSPVDHNDIKIGDKLIDTALNAYNSDITVSIEQGVTVKIPKGITTENFNLIIREIDNIPKAPDEMQILMAYDIELSFADVFEKDIIIRYEIDPQLYAGKFERDFAFGFYNDSEKEWQMFSNYEVNLQDGYVECSTDHLTAVGFIEKESDSDIKYGDGVKDIDGNEYPTVIIGNQEWMAVNLSVTRYKNGDEIPHVQDAQEWASLKTGAWCYYDNNPENGEIYGTMYNWYAINDERGLAPDGWKVPTYEDWVTLIDYAGGEKIAGGYLKSTRTAPDAHPRWDSPNNGVTDEYGFNALPGGSRNGGDGEFHALGANGYWWSSTQDDATRAFYSYIFHNLKYMSYEYSISMSAGMSVRCVKQ